MKAVVLLGPTAVGKSQTALHLAGDVFEIISADSVQVYRYLNIGSGKPAREDLEKIRHHLINIVDPDYHFTAGDYCSGAVKASETIFSNGKFPLFVGGTGLYIDTFFNGLSEIPRIDAEIKETIRSEFNDKGLAALYEELLRYDKKFAESIHPNDRQRILRGLEVYRATGRPLSAYFGRETGRKSASTLFIGLQMEREELHKRINERVDIMMRKGFLNEVAGLRNMGYGAELNSMRSIGYTELNKHLDGEILLDDAVEKIKSETRKYAKRQMTWFRKNKEIYWFTIFEVEKIKKLVYDWLEKNKKKIKDHCVLK